MSTINKPTIQFRALLLASEQRNAYGLRYNDYARYRKHCANRTHRVRSSLKITHGKGRDFKKLPVITTENIKEGHLQLLLYESERAWAFAQELLAQSLLPANSSRASTLRHSASGRFRRAVSWSTQLLKHALTLYSEGRFSASHLLEVHIYILILTGRFLLRIREEPEPALEHLAVARHLLLDTLARTAQTSRDQALAVQFADEIAPEVRLCAHELGRTRAYDVDSISAELGTKHRGELIVGCEALLKRVDEETQAEGGKRDARRLAPLLWEGELVPVRYPELVDALLRVQDAEKKLASSSSSDGVKQGSKKSVAVYDAILLALSDAENVAHKLVEAHQVSNANAPSAPAGTRDIIFVHAYITYQLLARRSQRDLQLTTALLSSSSSSSGLPKSSTKAAPVDSRLFPAVVKLLDSVLQSLEQMRVLSLVDESSEDIASAIDARISFTKARRCLYLSRCYTPVKKYAEALTLLQRGALHTRATRTLLSSTATDNEKPNAEEDPLAFYSLTDSHLTALEADLSADSTTCKQAWFTYNGGTVVLDDQQQQATAENRKAKKKPMFFDIALNYATLDMDRLAERAGKDPREMAPAAPVATTTKATSMLQEKGAAQSQQPQTGGTSGGAQQRQTAVVRDDISRSQTPEPGAAQQQQQQQQSGSRLGSLLGGWWGRS